ncbi:hypothetical protein HME9304_01141 [Flagellimonas maritima]|uniref:Uncharacterized protein n=1 Tax=Flagellimonas maritima TaxID=1383885 RepID=A0A2Z4LQI2_9FLAO|nr:hypothetical protein [Allomuricauda aurantiaca]AWX44141.1 hypothetical protein HME9304_01141 [Allomuricauda aurantiaca]
MKKTEHPIIFANRDIENTPSKTYRKNYDIKLGALFKIGNPKNKSYLFIADSLLENIPENSPNLPVHKIINQTVVVIGILEMSNGRYKAILERKDKNDFYRGQSRLYSLINEAIIARELIPL